MKLGDFVFGLLIVIFIFAFFKGLYNLAMRPIYRDYVYSCRHACKDLKKTADNKCTYFDLQNCFSDCLRLMINETA